MIRIRRALVSVSDKRGVVGLARELARHDCRIISTGGTRKALEEAGLAVTEVSAVSGNPEAFGGRMKTISFAIESAILFDRERDRAEASTLGIEPIDMVVCNLYPFAKYRDEGADLATLVEHIDIGGPTMIRAAAKNHRFVAVVTSPDQYGDVEQALRENEGAIPDELLSRLMREAFRLTAEYDCQIATAMAERAGQREQRLSFVGGRELRYGENPHQKAFFYRQVGAAKSLHDVTVHGGKELSYNNIVDLAAAVEAACALDRVGCAIVKHSNPCGLAETDSPRRALELAWAGDPVSAFGSVVAFNREVDRDAVAFLDLDHPDKARRKFVEVVAAPAFTPEALEGLRASKSLRIVEFDPEVAATATELKFVAGALLCQDADRKLLEKVEVVTGRAPSVDVPGLVEFGLEATRSVKSNAIVIVRAVEGGAFQLAGMGCGQPNRVDSTRLAIERARATIAAGYSGPPSGLDAHVAGELGRAILVSDAFFPFPDSIDLCGAAGIANVYQPGGSIRDRDVIARCDELGIAMALTGLRHFRH